MQSLSYGCFSTGMCDDRVKTLIDWQEGPFSLLSVVKRIGYSCITMKHLLGSLKSQDKAMVAAVQVERC